MGVREVAWVWFQSSLWITAMLLISSAKYARRLSILLISASYRLKE
jgi:hypothetical protein